MGKNFGPKTKNQSAKLTIEAGSAIIKICFCMYLLQMLKNSTKAIIKIAIFFRKLIHSGSVSIATYLAIKI